MELSIGIATCGRKDLLHRVLRDLSRQSDFPDRILIAPIDVENDVGALELPQDIQELVSVVEGPKGLTAQRNTILKELEKCSGIVLFLDDDFLLHKDYCKELRQIYLQNPDIVGCAGKVIADGINSPGIEFDDALSLVKKYEDLGAETLVDNGTTYGCNMSFRLETVNKTGTRFDEALPLYGWFEDLDFSAQIARYGRVINANRCVGVHMGHKMGRTSGRRLGYSQVVNPFYMWKKGTMPLSETVTNVTRRLVANLIRSVRPEYWVDRRGRVLGNIMGLFDILLGKEDPRRILEIRS
ncbi:glycosyltransferase family 2 protein [Microbulbifer sp. MCCC 1A16149]|uniref:glycosyltransferase family 2 protein n=1 Tax=Microbulbifer sp. MCCC 1A16149 TaxID=3411322 RepID=UPI003D1382DA